MSSRWVADAQSAIFTLVRKQIMDKYSTTYPDLYFTKEEDNDELETNRYPACYIKFDAQERGQTLDYGVNACVVKVIVDVTVSESMGLETAKTIIYEIMDILSEQFGFGLTDFPFPVKADSNIKRMIANTNYRMIGFNDVLFTS